LPSASPALPFVGLCGMVSGWLSAPSARARNGTGRDSRSSDPPPNVDPGALAANGPRPRRDGDLPNSNIQAPTRNRAAVAARRRHAAQGARSRCRCRHLNTPEPPGKSSRQPQRRQAQGRKQDCASQTQGGVPPDSKAVCKDSSQKPPVVGPEANNEPPAPRIPWGVSRKLYICQR
jgi:hypothetical protein